MKQCIACHYQSLGPTDLLKHIQSVHGFGYEEAYQEAGRVYGLLPAVSLPNQIEETQVRYAADIEAAAGALYIRVGALRLTLRMDERTRLALIALLATEQGHTSSYVEVAPLILPDDIRQIDEQSLRAREVR